LETVLYQHPEPSNSRIAITGQSAKALLDLPYRPETECIERALSHFHLRPDILLSLGGETFSLFTLKDGIVRNIISSSKCAAGTGEFLVQQFQRMGLSLEEGLAESAKGERVQLATRCSVYCKSDATHKLNKGECCSADISNSLVHDLAIKVSKMVELSQWPRDLVLITGGVSLNQPFVRYLHQMLDGSKVIILPESPYFEAFGASLLASELPNDAVTATRDKWIKSSTIRFNTLDPLADSEHLVDYRVKTDADDEIVEGASYILGVDAGSTTTKAVLSNASDGSIGARCYLRTLSNPVLATKNCLKELINQVNHRPIRIIQAAVTGSGRGIVSVYLDNCLSFNEILAHARGASEDSPDVDTVFEIGGQDSKFISFLEGVPIDYAMNEGCSAGTGSFLEESASVDMGIDMREISKIAERSKNPISFGERCAAFINTELRNALQQGASQEDVVGGLVYSIADNYISRIVGRRHLGENLLFLGGVALNRSVAIAIAARTSRNIVVPSRPELMGCVGAALMAKDLLNGNDAAYRNYNLEELLQGDIEVKGSFRCKACDNKCEIQRIAIRGKAYPFGGLCARYEMIRHKGGDGSIEEGRDLIEERNKIMLNDFGPRAVASPKGCIGLPMALTTYELFPLYTKLINELGYEVVLSKPSKTGNSMAVSSVCYPCEKVHGEIYDLLLRDVDYILLPRVIEFEIPDGMLHSYTCPSTTVIPDIILAAFSNIDSKLLSPHIGLSDDLIRTTSKEVEAIADRIGLRASVAKYAFERSLAHYKQFRTTIDQLYHREINNLINKPTVIIAGRPYTTHPPDVNLALPRKITSRGYNVISADMLPNIGTPTHKRNVWRATQQIDNAIDHVKKYPNMYICLISSFSCGPDSSMFHLFRSRLAGHTFCYLETDSHTAHAGFETRVGAFLDIIEGRQNRNLGSTQKAPTFH